VALGLEAVDRSIALTGLSALLPAVKVLAAAIRSAASRVVTLSVVFRVAIRLVATRADIRLVASPVVFTEVAEVSTAAEVAGKNQA
jgi:hypothetical protein